MNSFKARAFSKKRIAIVVGLIISAQVNAQDTSIEEIQVTGNRAALMNALEKQRESDQIVGVIDSDAMGNFADINVAESLRRISGIMVENDQGEGRYVSVRGINADLNSMTINGVSTASPEDRRGIMLDGVPTDMLDSITVYKTLTPNLDADTIGGAINLETISAFSYDGRHISLKAETSYNELTEDANNPTFSGTYTDRFDLGDGELGAAIVVSDQSRHIIAHNNENGGWSDVAPNDDYEMRFYDITRERSGIVLNLDYKTNSGVTLYAHSFFNTYADEEYRGKWETRDGLEENDPEINGNVFTYANTKMDSEGRQRKEERSVSAVQLGFEYDMDNGNQFSFELFGSQAEEDDRDKYAVIFRTDLIEKPISYDNSDPQTPTLSYVDEFYDPASFKLNAWEKDIGLIKDEDLGARFDMTMMLNADNELQFGGKYRQREKSNDYNFCGYDPLYDSTLADYESMIIPAYLNSVHGPAPTANTVLSFKSLLGSDKVLLSDGTSCQSPGTLFELSGDEEEESIAADWKTNEDIFAAYAMLTTQTDNATYVYGLRYEDTETTYGGKNFDGKVYAGASSFDNDYGFLAPSLNIKFETAEDQILRVGVFRSLIRPGFKESNAGAIINNEDNEIEGGNTDLDPTIAWNFDLGYEYYLNEETFIGGGVFYKAIEDSIVEVESNNLELRGRVWDVANTFINTGDSSLYGVEFSVQTALENGFIFVLNYTHTDGETDLPADSVSGERTIPYFKQASDTANLVLGYDKGKWDIRLATNFRSKYLDEVGDDELSDRYTDSHMQVDLTAKYRVTENLHINVAAMNLNDRPEYYYFGNSNRLSQYDEYGTTYTFGVRYSL